MNDFYRPEPTQLPVMPPGAQLPMMPGFPPQVPQAPYMMPGQTSTQYHYPGYGHGGGYEHLHREIQQLQRHVHNLEKRVDRIERRLGINYA